MKKEKTISRSRRRSSVSSSIASVLPGAMSKSATLPVSRRTRRAEPIEFVNLKEKLLRERKNNKDMVSRMISTNASIETHLRRHAKAHLLYLDPPWAYGRPADDKGGWSADPRKHYPVMSDDELRLFQFGRFAAKEAICAMWVPVSLLRFAIKLLEGQGFEFKSIVTWHKIFPSGANAGCPTNGAVLPCSEILIIASRGKGVPHSSNAPKMPSVMAVVRGEHSAKPAIFRDMLRALYPTTRDGALVVALELFARQAAKGWHAWGNEAPKKAGGAASTLKRAA